VLTVDGADVGYKDTPDVIVIQFLGRDNRSYAIPIDPGLADHLSKALAKAHRLARQTGWKPSRNPSSAH
jgi:hypothetical protein